MTKPRKDRKPEPELRVLNCRRTGQDYCLDEHARCPYCFGSQKDLESGEHEKFCDYEPGKDPVSFGFPAESSRNRRG